MNNIVARNKLFAKLPFDKKLKIVDELVEFADIIRSSDVQIKWNTHR